jgi:TonB family protein
MPQDTLPDSLRSVLASAGIGVAWTEDPFVPDPPLFDDSDPEAALEPVLTETAESDLPPEPMLTDMSEPDEPEELSRLDPARAAEIEPADAANPGAAVRPRGPVASFAVHAVVLLAFFDWPGLTPVDPPQPIPVALVIEQPPPETGHAPTPPPPPPGHLASENFGDVTAKDTDSGAPAPAETPKAEAVPPPQPQAKPEATEPKPAKDRLAMMIPPPKPTPPAPPDPKPAAAPAAPPHPVETPHRAPHAARFPGPAATRDEYLAYLLSLTRQHMDLLPLSVVGDRQGEAVVGILVLDDGTVARINVTQSSGYADIDRRVEQMVAAIGRFPPLPQWYQGPRVELNLRLRFPEALQE